MPKLIAMAGKGGVGKTTITALLVKYLLEKNQTPILVVDADPNTNLNELLGLDVHMTIGQIRKEIKGELPPHISRDQYMEMKVHQALIEETGFDLMVMGQPDGPGCYCAANQFLAMTMDHLTDNYKYILVDNEAGMEHLSRMNLTYIDYLLVVSDPSARGIMTAGRISEITEPLKLTVKNKQLIVNRVPAQASEALTAKIDQTVTQSDLPLGGLLHDSQELVEQELSGGSYLELGTEIPIIKEVYQLFDSIFTDVG